jgi:predicted dithiol-disulfide oxidoreductase (DUF899 family)
MSSHARATSSGTSGVQGCTAPTDQTQDPRHVGTIETAWNLFDLMPAGRGGDWQEQLDYTAASEAP